MENNEVKMNDNELENVVGGAGSVNASGKKAKIINCTKVNVRNAAGGGDVIGEIRCGTVVTYLGKSGSWGHIRTSGGLVGFIYKDYYELV